MYKYSVGNLFVFDWDKRETKQPPPKKNKKQLAAHIHSLAPLVGAPVQLPVNPNI